MFYDLLEEYKYLSVGDIVKIKNRFIPPCAKGITPVSSEFVNYILQEENKFTITNLKLFTISNFIYITVFEVMGVLEFMQVTPIITEGKIRIFNWNDKRI